MHISKAQPAYTSAIISRLLVLVMEYFCICLPNLSICLQSFSLSKPFCVLFCYYEDYALSFSSISYLVVLKVLLVLIHSNFYQQQNTASMLR